MNGPGKKSVGCAIAVLFATLFGCVVWLAFYQPRGGSVRVQAVRVQEDSGSVHWRWKIVGDRRWVTFSSKSGGGGYQITLQPEHNALKQLVSHEGSSTLNCELKITPGGQTAPGLTSFTEEFELIGATGGIPAASFGGGFSGASKSLGQTVRVLLTKDVTLTLPATLNLATVSGRPVSVRLE